VSSPVLVMLCGVLKLNRTIHTLDLSGVDMDVDAAKAMETALQSNSTLTSVDLRDNPKLWLLKESGEVSADGLDAIARGLHSNSAIEKVRVDKLELQVRVLKGAESNTTLTYAGSSAMSDVSAALIGTLVEHNKVAKTLDLSDIATQCTRLGHAAGRCLASNTALTTVLLKNSQLRDDGVSALSDGLKLNGANQVRVLDLASNGIGVAGAAKLAELLTVSTALIKLDLTANKLGSKGTETLVGGLSGESSKLAAISLRENDIDQAGARAIAKALQSNSAIVTLWLGKNKIGDEGTIALVEALLAAKHTSKVAYFDLHKNNITKVGIASLTTLVAQSPSLTALGLAGTKMQFTETEIMQTNAKENPELGRTKPVRLWMGTDMNKWPDF